MKNYIDKRTLKETIDADNESIDKSQTENISNNDINIRDIAESTDYDNRKAINKDSTVSGNSYNANIKTDDQFEKFAEMNRFNKSHEIDESAIRQNRKMQLDQKVDDTAKIKAGKSVQDSDKELDDDIISGLA